MDLTAEPELIIGVIIALGTILTTVIVVSRKLWPVLVRLKTLIDDWIGEPARPGVDRTPGVMERLAKIEHTSQQASFHSRPNHGSSSHDAVIKKLNTIESQLEHTREILDESVADRKRIWQVLNQHRKPQSPP